MHTIHIMKAVCPVYLPLENTSKRPLLRSHNKRNAHIYMHHVVVWLHQQIKYNLLLIYNSFIEARATDYAAYTGGDLFDDKMIIADWNYTH